MEANTWKGNSVYLFILNKKFDIQSIDFEIWKSSAVDQEKIQELQMRKLELAWKLESKL